MRNALLATVFVTTLMPAAAMAEAGDFLVRARAIIVSPVEETSDVLPALPGASVAVDDAFAPELDFTYFLSDRLALELILATTKHDIVGTGNIGALGEVGDTWVLPPTLTLQYHFNPGGRLRPYVGVGINYTIFYSEDTSRSLNDAIGQTSLDIDESVGIAVQAGVDIAITDNWFINADIKSIQIDTDATLRTETGGDPLINTIGIDLDPVVAGIGIGRRF